MTSLDFSTILPEVVLAAYALAALMAGAYLGKDKHAHAITWAYNCGYIKGRQQLVQDLYGDPPTARMF